MQIEEVRIIHFIPGRVRFKVASLKGSVAFAEKVRRAFAAVPAIKTIELNTLIGSVLLTYDPQEIRAPESAQALSNTLSMLFPNLDVTQVLGWLGANPASAE